MTAPLTLLRHREALRAYHEASTRSQLEAVERDWAHTPVESSSQIEMSAPKHEAHIGEVIAALVMIAIGWGGVSWLRHGGMDLIAGWLL